jgi:hypothetical protein
MTPCGVATQIVPVSSRSIPLIENRGTGGAEDRPTAGRSGDYIAPARSPRSERCPPRASRRLPLANPYTDNSPTASVGRNRQRPPVWEPRNKPRLVPIHRSPAASRTMRHMDGLASPSSSAKLCHCRVPASEPLRGHCNQSKANPRGLPTHWHFGVPQAAFRAVVPALAAVANHQPGVVRNQDLPETVGYQGRVVGGV